MERVVATYLIETPLPVRSNVLWARSVRENLIRSAITSGAVEKELLPRAFA